MSAVASLRARTAPGHVRVDTAFSAYDLADRRAYGAFLLAHARALPAAERFIARAARLPMSRPRFALLAHDLAQLDLAMPEPVAFAGDSADAFAWGVMYVVEGSRLGGSVLSNRVASGLPTAYLGARHEPGEWRKFGQSIDAEAELHDSVWLDVAVAGAETCFDLYARSAAA